MSNQLITNYFRLHSVKQFAQSITSFANNAYYIFVGKHTPYANGDTVVPIVYDTTDEVNVNSYRNMVFGKRVTADDVKIMVPRYDWTANTRYTEYRNTNVMWDSKFYVGVDAVSDYHVFKVLDNNGGAPSTVAPDFAETSASDEFYSTSDGYVWKYMYSVPKSLMLKFASDEYVPVVPNPNVSGNAVSGAIDVIATTYGGSNYDTYFSNTFNNNDLRIGGNTVLYGLADGASSNSHFYNNSYLYLKAGTGIGQIQRIVDYLVIGDSKRVVLEGAFDPSPDVTTEYEITPGVVIVGDGTGAKARAIVNSASSNSIFQVEIIDRGHNYTYATATVVGNTGGVSNTATVVPVIGPAGGHGYDAEAELGGRYLGISVTFANSESNTIPTTNDYRTVGILKDPMFANVELTLTTVLGNFNVGERVTQDGTNATGLVSSFTGGDTVQLTNVTGEISTGRGVIGAQSNASGNVASYVISGQAKSFSTFDQRTKYQGTIDSNQFEEDEIVYQTDVSIANAVFHSSDANYVYVTDQQGTINSGNTIIGSNSSAVATINSILPADLVVGSGQVLYLENTDPIPRSNIQSETVKLFLKF